MRRLAVIGGTALLALVVLAAALAFHDALAGAVLRAVASGAGYTVRFDRLQVGFNAATATGTNVTNRAGEPVFESGRIDVRYSLRNVLPGSNRRRFGISSLDIQRPTVTLIHHADGTYNVALPANSAAAKPDTSPIDLRLRVRDGSVVFLDRFVVPGKNAGSASSASPWTARSRRTRTRIYNVRFDLDDGHALHPVYGKAKFSADHGFEAQRWTAADIPVGPLIDFALPSHAINIVDGDMRNVDGAHLHVRRSRRHDARAHRAARGPRNGKIYVAGVLKPLRDARGPFVAYDNGLDHEGPRRDARRRSAAPRRRRLRFHRAEAALRARRPRPDRATAASRSRPSQRQPLTGDLTFALRGSGNLERAGRQRYVFRAGDDVSHVSGAACRPERSPFTAARSICSARVSTTARRTSTCTARSRSKKKPA